MRVEQKLNEGEIKAAVKTRNNNADRLIEKWSKRKDIVGSEFQEKAHSNLNKFRNMAILLENQERYLSRLTETQISSAYQTMPQNVMKVVRLGYGNTIRGEIFNEWAMETMRDSIWYAKPIYAETLRDGVINTVTHETNTHRYSSEIEIETLGTGDGSTNNFTGTATKTPIRPYKAYVLVDNVLKAVDDGSGVWSDVPGQEGSLATTATNTINYTTGAVDITFASAPATGYVVSLRYFVDTEVSTNYDELGAINLQLVDYQFRPDLYPLEVSWSKKAELLLASTLDVDIDNTLTVAAAEELKKSMDFRALREGYYNAKSNTLLQYNADWKSAGADSLWAHVQTVTHIFDKAAAAVYKDLQRGGVTSIYGGADAVSYLKMHNKFVSQTGVKQVGGYKVGTLDGINVYQVPASIVPADELVTSWVNQDAPTDVGVSIGVYIPMATTDKLTFKNFYTEMGIGAFEDIQTLNSKYCRRIKFNNLSAVLT